MEDNGVRINRKKRTKGKNKTRKCKKNVRVNEGEEERK